MQVANIKHPTTPHLEHIDEVNLLRVNTMSFKNRSVFYSYVFV